MPRNLADLRRRCLELETLEARVVPAGNVSVLVSGGDLIIRGDNLGNSIAVTPGANPLQFRITGTVSAGGPTTINRQAAITVNFVRDDWDIQLGQGSDALALAGVTVRDQLDIEDQGGAANNIALARVTVLGDTNIQTDEGNDSLLIFNSVFRSNVDVQLNDGNDFLAVIGTAFGQQLNVDTGSGNDRASIANSFFNQEVQVDLDDGDDILNVANSLFREQVQLNGDSGVDTLRDLGGNQFWDDLQIGSFENLVRGNSIFLGDVDIDD